MHAHDAYTAFPNVATMHRDQNQKPSFVSLWKALVHITRIIYLIQNPSLPMQIESQIIPKVVVEALW